MTGVLSKRRTVHTDTCRGKTVGRDTEKRAIYKLRNT